MNKLVLTLIILLAAKAGAQAPAFAVADNLVAVGEATAALEHFDVLDYLNTPWAKIRKTNEPYIKVLWAADNYFTDLSVRIKYYRDYLEKYENIGDERMLQLAENRLSDLIRQRHLAGE